MNRCQNCGKKLSQEEKNKGRCSNCNAELTFLWQVAGLPLWG